jgi:hypothetical protein
MHSTLKKKKKNKFLESAATPFQWKMLKGPCGCNPHPKKKKKRKKEKRKKNADSELQHFDLLFEIRDP